MKLIAKLAPIEYLHTIDQVTEGYIMRAQNKAKFNIILLIIVFSSVPCFNILTEMELAVFNARSNDFKVKPLVGERIPSLKEKNLVNLDDNIPFQTTTTEIDSSPTIGIIVSHNENDLQQIYNYYHNLGYWVEYIYSELNLIDFTQFDIVMVGDNGIAWDYLEIIALEDYIYSGGKLISIGDSIAYGIAGIAESYGIESLGYSIGSSGSTTNFDSSSSNLFDNVEILTLFSNNALNVSIPAIPILWDSSNTGIYGASVTIGTGNLLVLSNDFQNVLYEYDTNQLIINLLSWEDKNEIIITSAIYTNTTYNLTWEYNFGLGEALISNEIFIDGVSQGTTSDEHYLLPIGSEGIYNVSIDAYTNLTSIYSRWISLTVDFTSPVINPVSPLNNSVFTNAYNIIYWTVSDNLSSIGKQELYQTHIDTGIKESLIRYYNQDYGDGNTSFSRDGSYYIDIIVFDKAGNSNSSRIFVSADINAIGFPANHGQELLYNIMNYYRSVGCYVEFINESEFLISADWLDRMDMVILGGTGYLSYTREELLLIEDWFITGGTVVNIGGWNTSLSYTRWLSKLGLVFGQEIGSVYSSNFDGSSSLVSGISQLYFSNVQTWNLNNGFTTLVWDQSGIHTLIAELSSIGRFIAIGGYFDDGIWTVDNTELLDNILIECHTQNTPEVALVPSTLYSSSPNTTINWTYSLENRSFESAAIWFEDVLMGNVSSTSLELTGLTEGYHNLTLILYTNTSETIRCEREVWVDFGLPVIHEFFPVMNQTIKTVHSNASWNVTDSLSGILYESLIVVHLNASDIATVFIDPFNYSSYANLDFNSEGTYILQLIVVDWVGNQRLVNTTIHISYIANGFIEAHGEYSLGNIRNQCYYFDGYVERLQYGSHITYEWLERFDSVWIGFGGNPWSTIELNALNDYFEGGGTIIYVGKAGYRTSIQDWFNLIGLGNNTQGPYSMYTTTLLYQHPIFKDVTQIYLDSAYSWSIKNNDIKPIGWSQDGFYNVLSSLDIVGTAYLFSGDINNNFYSADNQKLVENIILQASETTTNSISVNYSSLFQSSSNFSISWEYDLNTVLDVFEIYIDSVYQGNTTSNLWNFTNLLEDSYNLTIVMYDNNSSSFSFPNQLIVDLTGPDIILNNPLDGDTINRTYLNIDSEATDSETYIIKEEYYWISPGDSSWIELSIQNGSQLNFPMAGDYSFMFSAWDRVGNRMDLIVEFTVDYLAVGFIQNHNENSLWNILNYYLNQLCYTETLYSPYSVTYAWLMKFDLVFIGFGGSTLWTINELNALDHYIDSGGYLVYSGRDTYSTPLEGWMNTKGISFYLSGPGTIYTNTFENTDPIFESINQLYFRYTYRSWSLSGSAVPIIWSDDLHQYIIGAQYDNFGRFLAFSGDINYRVYYANNEPFLWNILQEATRFKEGILIDTEYLELNTTNATIYWDWYLQNRTLDYFNITLEGEYQGSTNETFWQFTNMSEGIYNITVDLITNTSEIFSDSKELIIDFSAPNLLVTKPISYEVTNPFTDFEWQISDNLSGISDIKVYLRTPTNDTWTEHTFSQINENGTLVHFWESGIHIVKIIVTDYAGNSVEQILQFDVQIPTIGFVGTHDEYVLYNILDLYNNLGYFTYPLYYNDPVTEEWLNSIDILFIGYGGNSWTAAEIIVLDSFMESGGYIVYVGRGTYNIPLENWLQNKGIQIQYSGPGSTVTNQIDSTYEFFTNVSNLYFRYTDRSWSLSGEVQPIIWSNDRSYVIGAYYQNVGSLITLTGDINNYVYDYENEIFLQNLAEMAAKQTYGVYLKYSTLTTNQSSPTIEWNVALENSTVYHFEFYLDGVNLGSTTNYFWDLDSLGEGTYAVKVVLYDNNSIAYENIRTLTIDTSPPLVSIIHPTDERITSQNMVIEWNITENLSGILKYKFEIKLPGDNDFYEPSLDPYNPYQYYFYTYNEGSCQVRITAWDRAGNKKILLVDFNIDFYQAGMIRNHGEERINGVRNYLQNRGYNIDYLYEGDAVTIEWLNLYDLIIIGPYGYLDWTETELQKLELYLDTGGWIIHGIRDSNSPLLPWLNSKGLIYNSVNLGDIVTDKFTDNSLFENVTHLYFPYVQSSWITSGSAECLIQDSSGVYCLASAIESLGMFITFTGQMLDDEYSYDNSIFFDNLISATMTEINVIRIKDGKSKAINSDIYDLQWFSKAPDNAAIDNFKIYLDGVYLTTTTENSYEIGDLTEGTFTITVQAVLSTSETINDTQELIVDFTPPEVIIQSPTDSEVIKAKIITFKLDIIETLSGVKRIYIDVWNKTSNEWSILISIFSHSYNVTILAPFTGENTFRVRVIDNAENEGEDQVDITIDSLEILFTLSHDEYYTNDEYINDLYSYYSLRAICKYTQNPLTSIDLITTDLIVVLEGYNEWLDDEITALTNYLVRGGALLVMGRTIPNKLNDLIELYGLRLNIDPYIEIPSNEYPTGNISHSLFQNVTNLFLPTRNSYIAVNYPSISLLTDSTGDYTLIGALDSGIKILVISCRLYQNIWDNSTLKLMDNILEWVIPSSDNTPSSNSNIIGLITAFFLLGMIGAVSIVVMMKILLPFIRKTG